MSDPHEPPAPRLDVPAEDDEQSRSDGSDRPWPRRMPEEDVTERPAPTWPPTTPTVGEHHEEGEHEFHHPLDKVTGGLPRRLRIIVDWVVTIVGAVAIVLGIKAWVVNPYRIPSSSMEPTLHCARPATGCEARYSDRVLANRFIYHFRDPKRGEIVVFNTTPEVRLKCNAGGTFVKRIIGLPGETVQIRLLHGLGYVFVNGKRLDEPYIQSSRRDNGPAKSYKVAPGHYFMMGDNRQSSCDSRQWGGIPRDHLVGPVFMTYWPPTRISFR